VLVLFVAILLALISVATFPCWSYSARWGHVPSIVAGALLLCVAMVVVGGKSAPKAVEPDMEVVSASPATSATNAFHRRVETVIQAPENAIQ
jgi:hypothetical protein